MERLSYGQFMQLSLKHLCYTNAFLELIPAKISGIYLLYKDGELIYIGRSDKDLKRRLKYHNYRGLATHFIYLPCHSDKQAYILEKRLYYKYLLPLNKNFPAYPAGKLDQQHNNINLIKFNNGNINYKYSGIN